MSEEDTEDDKKKKKEKEPSYTIPLILGGLGVAGLALGSSILSPALSSGVRKFESMVDRVHGEGGGTIDPKKDLDIYMESGSDATGGNVLGVGVLPFMKAVRTSPFTPKEWRFWNKGTEDHYRDFSSGPLSAYFRYLDEHVESERHNNLTDTVLYGRPSILTSPIQFIKSIGNKEERWTDRINALTGNPNTAVSEDGIKAMKDAANDIDKWNYNLPEDAKSIRAKATELGKIFGYDGDNFSEMPRDTQKAVYSKLDEYLGRVDPELQKKKIFNDMVQGAYRVPTSSYSYGTLAKALSTTQDALIYGGGTLLAAGGGIALYKHLKAKEEKQKKEEEEEDAFLSLHSQNG